MQVNSKIIDDLARVAGGAFNALSGVRSEVEAQLKQQFESILRQMDVVSREEFEAVREMAVAAREEQERMAARLAALESAQAGNAAAPVPPTDVPTPGV